MADLEVPFPLNVYRPTCPLCGPSPFTPRFLCLRLGTGMRFYFQFWLCMPGQTCRSLDSGISYWLTERSSEPVNMWGEVSWRTRVNVEGNLGPVWTIWFFRTRQFKPKSPASTAPRGLFFIVRRLSFAIFSCQFLIPDISVLCPLPFAIAHRSIFSSHLWLNLIWSP